MKKLLLILLSVLAFPTFAQITITQSDFLALVGKVKTRLTYRSQDQALVASLIAKSGSSQSWSLDDGSFSLEDTTTEEFVAGTAGAPGASDPAFATATHYVKSWVSSNADSVNHAFVAIASDAVTAFGAAWDSAGVAHKIYYTPGDKVAQLPLSMGTKWTSTTALSYSQEPGFSLGVVNENEVDAEGTLAFPGGQSKQVLRVRTMRIMDFGFYKDTTTTYTFIAKSDREAATIIAPKSTFGFPIPGSVSYFSGGGGGGGNQDVTEAPQLTSPADGVTITDSEVAFSWGTVPKASSYRLQVSQTMDFQTILHGDLITGTSKTYALEPGQYYWRVAGVSAETKDGPWSATRTFTLVPLGVAEQNLIFTLEPNRPNPFTAETKIGYTLKTDSYVSIVVHDQLGNKVATLVDGMEHRGSHTAIFDGREIPSGQYFYTLTADGQSMTMPMILVKN